METLTVSFFGHRELDNSIQIEQDMERTVRELIRNEEYVEFLVGRSGAFDILAASVVRRVNAALDRKNTSLVLVLPYMTAEVRSNMDSFSAYYDEIQICSAAEKAHFKAAIQIRNREMVDRSDLIISYILRRSGGAYQTVRYAKSRGKKIINLAEYCKECD